AQPAMAARSRTSQTDHASAAVRVASVAGDVQLATGDSASQLSTRAACGAAPAGKIRCYARVLTLESTGRAVAPLHRPHLARAGAAASASAAYTAAFLQSAYDTAWLSANDGASDTVAIVDAYGDSTAYSDMEQFRSANGLPSLPTCGGSTSASCFELVNQNGQTTNLPSSSNDETEGWNVEESLDIDAVSSICPLCKILMVEANSDDDGYSPDLEDAVSAAARLGANQISLSWGDDTTPDASGWESPYSSVTSAAILAAAGDGSYPGPDVGYPAALPSVTAVGGTSLTADPSAARGYGESAWSLETCSGGSTCATESGCDTSQSRSIPSYQSVAMTSCNGRAYNDISADADPSTGLEIYDSQPGNEGCGTSNNWCIVGGTSLATPLTAALEGVTGISGATTPAWTYSDASLLNDIVSGSDGTCPSGWSLICNTAIGWDGPTGNGTISGDLVTGGPGVGGSDTTTNASDVTLAGGIYPNGESTSYYWEYWPSGDSSATASTRTASVSGSTLQAVSSSVCSTLQSDTTYDYDLVATNTSGTETGYQGTFATGDDESVPTYSSAPTVSGSAVSGQTLTGADADWNASGCNSSPSYAWQESSTGSAPWTPVGTAQTYELTSTDVGQYVRFTATESNGTGDTTVGSAVVGPVTDRSDNSTTTPTTPTTTTPTPTTTTPTPSTTTPTPTTTTPTPTTTTPTPTTTTPTPTTSTGSMSTTNKSSGAAKTSATASTTVRFYRCARTCRLINTHGATSYQPKKVDYGRYIKVLRTASRITAGVETTSTSTHWVGPITSTTAGDISLGRGARVATAATVRGSTGRPLAQVRVVRRRAARLTLVVRRKTAARTRVWAYVLSGGRVVSATRARSLRRPVTLSVALKRGQTIRLVAVRT
ncbi:MAG: S53 family peptidase, partial [Solirubrobacteraceae bacterium]